MLRETANVVFSRCIMVKFCFWKFIRFLFLVCFVCLLACLVSLLLFFSITIFYCSCHDPQVFPAVCFSPAAGAADIAPVSLHQVDGKLFRDYQPIAAYRLGMMVQNGLVPYLGVNMTRAKGYYIEVMPRKCARERK